MFGEKMGAHRMWQYMVREMEIGSLSDVEFKSLVVWMLRDLIKFSKCIREEMRATLCEIKKNPQGTNNEGKEARFQINDLEHKEEINRLQYRMKKQKFKKTRTE